MIEAIHDALHVGQNDTVVVAKQNLQSFYVDVPGLVSVYCDLVVVSCLEDHVEDGLLELVLDQEVGAAVLLEQLDHLLE